MTRLQEKTSRRRFLGDASRTVSIALIGPSLLGACKMENAATIAVKPDPFDEALKLMAEIAPLSNHGPMAAEALVELGHEDRVIEFAKLYNRYYASSYPVKTKEVTDSNWKDAIGERTRLADWVAFFEKQTNKGDWKKVVSLWVPRLAPGYSAAAAHGVIRTGHAIRSLERAETDVRLQELGQALGYWAAYFHKLPENNNKIEVQWPADGAIGTIPMIDQKRVSHTRSIMGKLEVVTEWEEFGSVINMLDLSPSPEKLISDLTETFAGAYIKHVTKDNCVSMIHSVTGTAMLRSIVPHVASDDAKDLIRYAWQTAAAIYSASGNETVNKVPPATDLKPADLVKRAVASNEVHAIKFTEACLREYELNRIPVFLIAIDDALGRLGSVG
ncbi:MAG: questin oxidase family protein [Acidobacteriota bacterium]|nr:questin oxidase family protein [Acidobacteriota bacterium]